MVCGTEPSKGCRLHDVGVILMLFRGTYALGLIISDTSQVAFNCELLES